MRHALRSFPQSYLFATKIISTIPSIKRFLKKKEESPDIGRGITALYRDIAAATHPDKGHGSDKLELFYQAAEAKKEKEVVKLVAVALQLKIDTDVISYDDIELLELEIEKKEKEVGSLRKSYPWIWYYSENKKKEMILRSWYECNKCM